MQEADQQDAIPRSGEPREDGEGNLLGTPDLQGGEANADCEASNASDDAAHEDHGRDGDFRGCVFIQYFGIALGIFGGRLRCRVWNEPRRRTSRTDGLSGCHVDRLLGQLADNS